MNQVLQFIFQIAILMLSVIIHEVSHGAVAYALGDSTAKDEGRLTLNPVNHLDPFGSILLPMLTYLAGGFIFGWAKPVPYNPYNLKKPRWLGKISPDALVGAAGPLSNILLAVIFGFFIRFGGVYAFLPPAFFQIASFIVFLNLILAIFNLVPIPPLDGSKVLFAFLPGRTYEIQRFMERYGIILLLIFIFLLSGIIIPIADFLFSAITGLGI
ncbi:MAG: site-2 protease family protein [Candidatus Giovannonibacteria bacterium]|nr:site-2 protease family protein [Candidatus Giovannonibacteria bacterium]